MFSKALAGRLLTIGALGVVGAIGFSAYAFTASNTVPDSNAGDGDSTVSGYTISDIEYGLNASTPTNIDTVSFTIAPATAGTTKAKMDGNWYDCTNTAGAVVCDTDAAPGPQLTAVGIENLEALAVQNAQ